MDSIGKDLRRRQLLTTEAKALETTVNNCPRKGSNYAQFDDLYKSLSDLVNDDFRKWYLREFHKLGIDTVMRLAATARQESHTDMRRHFSILIKIQVKSLGL